MKPIQLAFQGGGARFIEMLPVAHALADAHKQKIIRIARVAGCSAGSICAALIACEADFDQVKKFLLAEGADWAAKLRRFSTNLGKKCYGANIDWARASYAILQAGMGISLLRQKILLGFLALLFEKAAPHHFPNGRPASLMENVNSTLNGIKLVITASDLSRSQGEAFETGNILDRIACSCAIPFAFRTFSDVASSPYVDGGICDLLPVERLLEDEDTNGPVFSVSIVEGTNQPLPTSFIAYCKLLLSASMNHNVERSKRMAGHSNVIEVKTTFSTFDFDGALDKLADDGFYQEQYQLAFRRMVHYSQLYQDIPALNTYSLSGRVSAPRIMRSLADVFEGSLATKGWFYKKGTALIRADSLLRGSKNGVRLADRVAKIAVIEAKVDNLVCFMSAAPMDVEGSIISTNWTCFNQTKNFDLRIKAVPVSSARQHGQEFAGITEVLLFFEDKVSANDRIIITSYYMLESTMDGLMEKGSDYIVTKNNHPFPVEVTDIVLVYPTSFGAITVAPDSSTRGVIIDKNELEREHGSTLSTDYSFVGLRVMNQQPGVKSRAIFTKLPLY